ncbi:transcriptional regulator, LysR family [Arboricoccus pini]|uniref:Transcriptional regulator, LysR family n=1 Tax=Arboricoccus pini TaxID=1963835 RepID=A0A212QTE0_9PROT|nr:transcriptional regulator GcvA [Arboricoccus pini]SNB62900.1 transcriptional regulator, LysR family [Arboricoccus pini]
MTLNRLPPLNSLRAFLAAARYTSFVKAGDELGVTPAAISQQVKQLEAALSVELFERMPRGLVLTESARAAMPELEKAFAHLARAVTDLQGASIAGPLIVSVIPSFAARWLVPRIAHFIAGYPDIELTLKAEIRNVEFSREDVDIGIRYGRGIYPGLETRLLLTEEVFPVCAPALMNAQKPLRRLDDLRHHVLLHDRTLSGDEPSLTWRAWLQGNDIQDFDATRGPGFTDATMMIDAAARGAGIALGRSALVADDLASGRLVRPFPIQRPAEYAYYAVTPEGASRQPRVRLFISWLEEQATISRNITAI